MHSNKCQQVLWLQWGYESSGSLLSPALGDSHLGGLQLTRVPAYYHTTSGILFTPTQWCLLEPYDEEALLGALPGCASRGR